MEAANYDGSSEPRRLDRVSFEIAGLAFALVDQMKSYFAEVAADFELTPPHSLMAPSHLQDAIGPI
ncbi:MAG: hypothetical protein ACR2NR_05615 [Solirubrobacteraceae bacterium]